MPIFCPTAMGSCIVTPGASGSGTICVSGRLAITHTLFPIKDRLTNGGSGISVLVYPGSGNDYPTTPPASAGVVTANILSGGNWCATGVPIPASSLGQLCTVVSWQSAGGVVVEISTQPFTPVLAGAGALDCCQLGCCATGTGTGTSTGTGISTGTGSASGSGVGSGSDPGIMLQLAKELGTDRKLHVHVSDGPHKGKYKALPVAYLTWATTIGGETYVVTGLGTGGKLVLRHVKNPVLSTSVEFHPFSATFSGATFEATREVVVTPE